MRESKIEYYLKIAQEVAKRSPCARRKFGAVIVKNDKIVSTGYNGSARDTFNCGIDNPCIKDLSKEPSQVSYANCSAVHAEDNAISSAGWDSCYDAVMYICESDKRSSSDPCFQCRRKIINSQLAGVYGFSKDGEILFVSRDELIQKELEWQEQKLNTYKPNWKEEMVQ
jgi:dCMP deaminase